MLQILSSESCSNYNRNRKEKREKIENKCKSLIGFQKGDKGNLEIIAQGPDIDKC